MWLVYLAHSVETSSASSTYGKYLLGLSLYIKQVQV